MVSGRHALLSPAPSTQEGSDRLLCARTAWKTKLSARALE
ncbi:hypothetical protein AB395_00005323 (plasmid) [Sinorhizobium fredii CCBAU 45436]|nr:hypothetical protein AB395_00005323 [Sinorhizobium fredii CCBAU 45436]